MKNLTYTLFLLLVGHCALAQVGINTENPRVLLDVNATNEVSGTPGTMTVNDGIVVPRVTSLLFGTANLTAGQIIYLTTSFTDTTPNPDVVYDAGFYVSDGSGWILATAGTTGSTLEGQVVEITEGGNTGYVLRNENRANFGNIGKDALDLSQSNSPSTTRGASGEYAFAAGIALTASGRGSAAFNGENTASGLASAVFGRGNEARTLYEFVTGSYSTDYTPGDADSFFGTDRLFSIGNGTDDDNRSDALIVRKNGRISAPTMDISEITTNKTLTTKEFTDSNYTRRLPSGNTASRPATADFGTMRYNTQKGRPEVYVQNSTNVAEGSTYVPGWITL